MMSGQKAMFWKPGAAAPSFDAKSERSKEGDGAGSFVLYNPNISLSMRQQRQKLPVFKYRNHILYLLEEYQTLVVVGETGSGKSTQIPQYLLESGWTNDRQIIAIVQPRRVAATTVAERVADEMGSNIGAEVGYSIRFEDTTSAQTRIKFMTDGYLVREMMSDPLLMRYSVIMIDEAHERTLFTDIAIGLLKKILRKRSDLRLIVSSATLNAEEYRDFFNLKNNKVSSVKKTQTPDKNTSTIISVEGRMFPVDVFYVQNPTASYIQSSVDTVLAIHRNEVQGDVLVFLTGQDEVETVVSRVKEQAKEFNKDNKLLVLPMYGGLPFVEQLKVFQRTPEKTRKIVITTNIAEASITINGIVYVVDCGFVKLRAYNSTSCLESLVIVPTSQASSDQRAGRAGRVRAGKTFRLYPESEFSKLDLFTCPEMQRTDLSPVILQLKCLGVKNVLRFSFLSRPPAQCMVQALELLYALGAIDRSGELTDPLGVRMAEFPVEPMLAKMLLTSAKFGCSKEICTIAAMLQVENIFVQPPNKKRAMERAKRKFSVLQGDHLTLLNVFRSFLRFKRSTQWCRENFLNHKLLARVERIRGQLLNMLDKFDVPRESCGDDDEALRKCIVSGFFANAAKYHPSGEYRTIRNDHPLHLHPSSVLVTESPPRFVVFHQVLCTSKDYMRDVTAIESSWLTELAPHFYDFGTDREFAAAKRAKIESEL